METMKTNASDSDEDFIIENIEEVPNVAKETNVSSGTGAIKKTLPFNQMLAKDLSTKPFAPQIDFSKFSNFKHQYEDYLPANFQSTVDLINSGIRVCVILRGAPGSGKSWLANKIIERTVKKSHRNHIFSADDYFMDPDGNYRYDNTKIPEAHEYNQNRFQKRAREGWSPLIVDNTNTKIWEMTFYIKVAVENEYHVELMEPSTPWKSKPGVLQQKNKHKVPAPQIKIKLDNYERAHSVDAILNSCNLMHLKKTPAMRHFPVQHELSDTSKIPPLWDDSNWIQIEKKNQSEPRSLVLEPKPARQAEKEKIVSLDFTNWSIDDGKNKEAGDYTEPVFDGIWQDAPSSATAVEESNKKLRKEDSMESPQPQRNNNKKKNGNKKLSPHRRGCLNENQAFSQICEMYPQINDEYLWDLFLKTKGNAEWTVDLLLCDENIEQTSSGCNLSCNCFKMETPVVAPSVVAPPPPATNNKKEKDTTMKKAIDQEERKNLIKNIEEKVMMSQTAYPDHVRTVKSWKEGGKLMGQEMFAYESISSLNSEEKPLLMDDDGSSSFSGTDDGCSEELIEIDLGLQFIERLDEIFGGRIFKEEIQKSSGVPTKVFMRRSVGEELYALWLEQFYSKMEEDKFKCYKEDEELAKQIHSKENGTVADKTPETLEEIMEMEEALRSYQTEIRNQTNELAGNDWAAKMSREKLFELFPDVDQDFLVEILVSQNNNFKETVDILKDSLQSDWNSKMKTNANMLIARSKAELEKEESSGDTQSFVNRREDNIVEIKRNLDEVRQQIEFHRNSKQACMNKAREAIQSGQYSTANYYTNMCNLHKMKIDTYNNKAAAFTAQIHETTQSDANVLDLHYLSLNEAIQVLDIFLDKHINKLRMAKKPYKDVFIITGRGKNSVGGIPAIKIKAKKRLFERRLKATEDNPGLLKVKLFSTSYLICEMTNN